ncbi:MAG: hypothetical protein M1820_005776 [Bogoriella megaspora]|nr:MAG: hypothetical protein M1820_005776 [Bogoriella megaspora]
MEQFRHNENVTPALVHSTHFTPSAHTTPPLAHPLTLHEYRKQQLAPHLHSRTSATRLKRKKATPELNSTRQPSARLPLSPPPDRANVGVISASPRTSKAVNGPLSTGSKPHPPLRLEDSNPSFTSLLESYCDRSSSAPPVTVSPALPSRRAASTQGLIPTSERVPSLFSKRTSHLRPSKRLPRPQESAMNFGTFAPAPPARASIRQRSIHDSDSHSNQPKSLSSTAASPTTLHFRGASFDVVNPHNSLDLLNIETPGDAELTGYFETKPEPPGLALPGGGHKTLTSNMDLPDPSRATHREQHGVQELELGRTTTPQRAVYEDLTSAHQAITSRLPRPSNVHRTESELPQKLAAADPSTLGFIRQSRSFSDLSAYIPQPLNLQKNSASPSVLQRVTSIFRRNKTIGDEESKDSTTDSQSIALVDQPGTPEVRAPSIHQQWFQKRSLRQSDFRSTPHFTTQTYNIVPGDTDARLSVSQPEVRHSAYVSNYGDGDPTDHSIELDRPDFTLDWRSRYLDYSDAVPDPKNLWSFAGSSDTNALNPRMPRMPHGRTTKVVPDRYIGNSGQDYGCGEDILFPLPKSRAHPSSVESIGGYYEDDGVSRPSPLLNAFPTSGADYEDSPDVEKNRGVPFDHAINHISSGFSQFDFDLNESTSSLGSSEELPQAGIMEENPNFPSQASLDDHLKPAQFRSVQYGPDMNVDTSSYASSYGDTRNLLLLSPLSQARRENTPETKLGSFLPETTERATSVSPTSRAIEDDMEPGNKSTSNTTSHNPRPRPRTRKRISNNQAVENELRRVSCKSGISNLSGSIYVLDEHGTTAAKRLHDSSEIESPRSNFFQWADRDSIPRMWQECSPNGSGRFSGSAGNHYHLSSTKSHESNEQDWETIPDASRGDMSFNPENVSFGDLPELPGGSFLPLTCAQVRPGNSRYEYTEPSSPTRKASMLMPSYDFRDGAGFPRRNTLTPPSTAISHQHPNPLGLHKNPFNTPPPDLSPGPSPGRGQLEDRLEMETGLENNTEQNAISNSNNDSRKQHPFSISSTTFDVVLPTKAGLELRVEASSDIKYDRNRVAFASPRQTASKMPTEPPLPTISSEDPYTNNQFGSNLRSSIISDSNSFAKVSVVGPKVNLTGTPMGTGMREVGSSEADNSSPGIYFSSSPPADASSPTPTPRGLVNDDDFLSKQIEYKRVPSGTLQSTLSQPTIASTAPREGEDMEIIEKQSSADSWSPKSKSTINLDNGNRANEGRQRQHNHLRLPSKKWAVLYENYDRTPAHEKLSPSMDKKSFRRSVRSQKELMPMRLSSNASARRDPRDPAREHQYPPPCWLPSGRQPEEPFRTGSVLSSALTETPLLPRPIAPSIHRSRPSRADMPSLKPRSPSPSFLAESQKRIRVVSWTVFAFCMLFPPALIMYGFGWMDSLMVSASDGEVGAFGSSQKRLARYAGIVLTVGVVVAITAFMIAVGVNG